MNIYLIIILTTIIGFYILDLVTDYLNLKNLQYKLPQEFEGYYDAEKYTTSQKYLKENTSFSHFQSTFSLILILLLILLGGFNYLDQFVRSFGYAEIVNGLIFMGILTFGSQIIGIPFSIYHTFVIEEKYGFNKTTAKTFIFDILKSWVLTIILGGLVLAAILLFFEKTGAFAWLYCFLFVTIFQIIMLFLAPTLIMPLFNKFEPLKDQELEKKIAQYAKTQNFKLKGIFQMDGSRRSSKSNAFFTGFGRFKKIALFDTLIAKHTHAEIVSVLAHEIGHYKKKHILKQIIISIISTGFMFYILSLFINNPTLFAAFKMQHLSIYASLIFFSFLFTPINFILSIFSNILSRKHEYEADHFAVTTTKDQNSFITTLKKLSVDNLSNLTPHPFYVFLKYSHPPVLARIKSIKNIEQA
ncbi:M48 family metallopeptidase [bacterium]|jgi:STE24 endopeptidase|nr:M48 family metallopeptidase [bacterium]MBT3580807.1 M48 family metallopeptidase [bacterium]MBT4551854.1 M48 family metallopeptidase [bacterium]MBT7088257.1 M48 family metallopeptidase [bacterium]